MHTQGMTVEQATKLFETQAHQPHPVAVSEAKRGTADALYGYYTMGKLMILKLRDDYKAKMGARTPCKASTTRSSSSGRCRCRSSGRRCWVKPATSSSAGPCIGHQGCYARWTDRRLKRAAPNKGS